MKNTNWKDVSSGGEQPTKGGYICKIIAVEDDEDREFLKISLDIDEGEFAGYFQDLYDRFGFYGLTTVRSYKETAKGLFKKFLKRLEESNQGFVADLFDNDPEKLLNLRIGAVTTLRRYTKNNVADLCSVSDILEHNFTVPDDIDDRKIETATVTPTAGFVDVPEGALEDTGLPFR